MPRTYDDEDFDDDDDFESDDFDDEDDDGEEETISCPYCRREIYEDAVRCPCCEQYLSQEDSPPSRRPWWIIAGAVVCLYIVYRWITGW